MNGKTMCAIALTALVTALGTASAQEAPAPLAPKAPSLKDILLERADSVVSIKCVLKVQMNMMGQSRDQERKSETRGMLINGRGLILTSNSAFEGGMPAGLMRMLGDQVDIKATPTDVRVLFGNEVEEYEAQLVARDSNLGLAFVQIMDLKGREVKPVDLSGGRMVEIGQELVGVTRLPRGFDCAPAVGTLMVRAGIEKPRKMWAVAGEFAAPGHVIFDRFGQPVGILSIQSSSEGVSEGGDLDILGMADAAQNLLPVVLPLSETRRSLEAAEKRAAEALEKFQEDKEDKEE